MVKQETVVFILTHVMRTFAIMFCMGNFAMTFNSYSWRYRPSQVIPHIPFALALPYLLVRWKQEMGDTVLTAASMFFLFFGWIFFMDFYYRHMPELKRHIAIQRSPLGKWAARKQKKERKFECSVCLEELPKSLFCEFCPNHPLCVNCFVDFVKVGVEFKQGSSFLCPVQEETCLNLSSPHFYSVHSTFMLDHFFPFFSPVTFWNPTMAWDVIQKSMDRYADFALRTQHNVTACPYKSCKHLVFFDTDDLQTGRELNETLMLKVDKTENKIKKNVEFEKTLVQLQNQDEVDDDIRQYKCGKCTRTTCTLCRRPWTNAVIDQSHSGISCFNYEKLCEEQWRIEDAEREQSDELIKNRVREGLMMPCPTCGEMIEKNGGCNSMYCTGCNGYFTWIEGGQAALESYLD